MLFTIVGVTFATSGDGKMHTSVKPLRSLLAQALRVCLRSFSKTALVACLLRMVDVRKRAALVRHGPIWRRLQFHMLEASTSLLHHRDTCDWASVLRSQCFVSARCLGVRLLPSRIAWIVAAVSCAIWSEFCGALSDVILPLHHVAVVKLSVVAAGQEPHASVPLSFVSAPFHLGMDVFFARDWLDRTKTDERANAGAGKMRSDHHVTITRSLQRPRHSS